MEVYEKPLMPIEMNNNTPKTDRALLLKSLKSFAYTVMLMFTAPIVIYQAFKNQGHPWYWPVLIVGLLLAVAAIVMGFYSLKTIMKSFFGSKTKKGSSVE